MKTTSLLLFFCIGINSSLSAKISTPALFGSNMVLQQNHACPVWGKAEPSASISLSFAGKTYQTKANVKGSWRVTLDPHPATSNPLMMKITEKSSDEKKSSNSLTLSLIHI